MAERHEDVSKGLVMAHTLRQTRERLDDELLSFTDSVLVDELSNLGQRRFRGRIESILWSSVPDRVLVHPETLHVGGSSDHGPKTAIANGSSFLPEIRGFIIVKSVFCHVQIKVEKERKETVDSSSKWGFVRDAVPLE